MKIVSTTIVGPGGVKELATALESVRGIVDEPLVIWTGQEMPHLETTEMPVFGCHLWEWRDDFAAARNEALDHARICHVDWAITLDSDERIEARGDDLRAFLETTSAPVVYMRSADGTYTKPRAIRIPCASRWRGPSHEYIPLQGPEFPRARFRELPKSEERARFKNERGLRLLTEYSKAHPKEGRWHYYMGDQLNALGRGHEALEAFERCSKLSKWDEEIAYSIFRAAQILERLEGWRGAFDRCVTGLAAFPWSDELAWYAAYLAYQGRWYLEAARRASEPREAYQRERLGFRLLKASYEGPPDVLRHAARHLGLKAVADGAEKLYRAQLAEREALST